MMTNNPVGEELEVANTNWLLMTQLAKAGGVAETAFSLLGQAKDAIAANKMLVRACQDIAALVDLDQFQNTPKTENENAD